jgi:acyl-CoA synthetase (NDP forming)
MVGDYETAKTLAEQAGVTVCESFDEFQDLGLTFCLLWERSPRGRRVGVVTNAGFEATAAADRLRTLRLAELSSTTMSGLRAVLPEDVIDPHNPLDATPVTNTARFAECVRLFEHDEAVDCLVVSPVPPTPALNNLTPSHEHNENIHASDSLPSLLLDIFHSSPKPMVFCVDSGPLYDPMVTMLLEAGAPCFRHIDRAMYALASFVEAKSQSLR